MNAILKYPGAKWTLADWIISFFPPHKVYLEPYFGSGAVFFNKSPAQKETINDVNGDIVNLFKACRDHPAELAAAVNLTPFARQEFLNCRDRSDNEVEQARRFLVRCWQSFGSVNKCTSSWKNNQSPTAPNDAKIWAGLPWRIIEVCRRVKSVQIENMDAAVLIAKYNDPDTLIYCDPPYLPSTRTAGKLYKAEMTVADHQTLLSELKRSRSQIVLSGYDSELYNDTLSDWYRVSKHTTAQLGVSRTETLYMNYIPPLGCGI